MVRESGIFVFPRLLAFALSYLACTCIYGAISSPASTSPKTPTAPVRPKHVSAHLPASATFMTPSLHPSHHPRSTPLPTHASAKYPHPSPDARIPSKSQSLPCSDNTDAPLHLPQLYSCTICHDRICTKRRGWKRSAIDGGVFKFPLSKVKT